MGRRRRRWIGKLTAYGVYATWAIILLGVAYLFFAPTMGSTDGESSRPSEYDADAVEAHFIQLLNEERAKRGLQTVSEAPKLDALATDHAAYMAENDYIGHVQNGNQDIKSRYREAGFLPECKLSIEGDTYYPGTENVANGYWEQDMRVEWADGDTFHADSNEELAEYLFRAWMNSGGHREAMLVHSADEASLGLHKTDSDEVYAALEMC